MPHPYQSLQKDFHGDFRCEPHPEPLGRTRRPATRAHHQLRLAHDPAYVAKIEAQKAVQYFRRNPLAAGA